MASDMVVENSHMLEGIVQLVRGGFCRADPDQNGLEQKESQNFKMLIANKGQKRQILFVIPIPTSGFLIHLSSFSPPENMSKCIVFYF
jgi:hypothetical protein